MRCEKGVCRGLQDAVGSTAWIVMRMKAKLCENEEGQKAKVCVMCVCVCVIVWCVCGGMDVELRRETRVRLKIGRAAAHLSTVHYTTLHYTSLPQQN